MCCGIKRTAFPILLSSYSTDIVIFEYVNVFLVAYQIRNRFDYINVCGTICLIIRLCLSSQLLFCAKIFYSFENDFLFLVKARFKFGGQQKKLKGITQQILANTIITRQP
jgi:hypothetical protein